MHSKSFSEKVKAKPVPPPAQGGVGGSGGLTPQQKKALEKQREGYKAKLDILEREIGRLVAKEDELANSKSDMKLIEENLKLQVSFKNQVP